LIAKVVSIAVISFSSIFAWGGISSAGDSTGFYFGTDGTGPAPSGVDMPSPCSGSYGFYSGRVNVANDGEMHVSYANQAQADANNGAGVGSMPYGDLEGPKNDPSFNDTASEATYYGVEQANGFGNSYDSDIDSYDLKLPTYPLVFADMEAGNLGWMTLAKYGYSNWQTLNRDVYNGFVSQIETWTLPNMSETMEPAMYANPLFYSEFMPSQTITGNPLWEASWAYNQSGNFLAGQCGLTDWTAPSGFSPQSIFGQSTSSACFEFWQFASTNGDNEDWDQTDHARLSSFSCPT
jgi:hypothetical protein